MNVNDASSAAMAASLFATAGFQLLRDVTGNPQYVVALTEDITERKRVQEERNRLAKQMEMLLESTGQGIYGIDLARKLHVH